MKFLPIVLGVILITSIQDLKAQNVLTGMITDSRSQKPIANANVYLPELHVGAVSGTDGNYQIPNLPEGTFTVQFSYVGFRTEFRNADVSGTVNLSIAMTNTGIEGEDFVVYGTQASSPDQTANNIVTLSQKDARQQGSFTLADALSKIPGMSQLSTGIGISKPVIRGLYGNRIQTQVMGIRFDNQQWQDEHGLGLMDAGIDKIQVIKGPAALSYGSEAMGGVLNIIEEQPAHLNELEGDASLRLFSNDYGADFDAGLKEATDKFNWRLRIAGESHADYTDGDGNRVFNSRFDGYCGKGTFGWNNPHWVSVNNAMFSLNRFGFIFDTGLEVIDTTEGRLSRGFSGPHHQVMFGILTSQNTFFLPTSQIKFDFGGDLNRRKEDEGGGGISLDMQLNTFDANAQWQKFFHNKTQFSLGIQPMLQTNTNYGIKVIVPDANIFENGIFAQVKEFLNDLVIEGGLRFDYKNIQTLQTNDYHYRNDPELTFNKSWGTVNGAIGASWNVKKHFDLKLNESSGYRTPNLAELFSYGIHEGTDRFEIGNPEMKVEQNLNSELSAEFYNEHLQVTISAYLNHFFNYVYLNPTDSFYYQNLIRYYVYVQQDANLSGGEATIDYDPAFADWLDVTASYSLVRGKTVTDSTGNYLPFMPADRIQASLRANLPFLKRKEGAYVSLGGEYYFKQDRPAQFETPTPAYFQLNASAGVSIQQANNHSFDIGITGTNLTDKAYFDALSRFKDLGILNPGIDINLNLTYKF